MGLPLIGYPNRADDATLSGGSWESSLPQSNVLAADIGVVARSTDPANTRIDLDLGGVYQIRLVMVYLPNATLDATVRIYADDEATFTSPPYDTGANSLYPTSFFPASTAFYGEDVGGQQLTQETYNEGLRYPHVHIAATAQAYRYWRIDVADTNPDGYLDVGRVFVGSVYRPTVSWRDGGAHGYADANSSLRTQAGKKRGVELPSRRVARLMLPVVPEDEATIQCLDIMRRIDTDEQFAFVFDEDDVAHLQRRTFLAVLEDTNMLTFPAEVWQNVPFAITEQPMPHQQPVADWQIAYVYKTGGRYETTTDSGLANASFVTGSGDGRLYIQDSVEDGSLLGYVDGRGIVVYAPTV